MLAAASAPRLVAMNGNYCTLHLAAEKKVELCPHDLCALWEPGGAVLAGGCMIERLGVDISRRDLALYLLELRERVDEVKGARR
jgi:hypothetical protein